MSRRDVRRVVRSPAGLSVVRVVVAVASLLLAVGWSTPPASGWVVSAVPVHHVVSAAAHAHAASHKQGTVAVAVSVVGIVVVIAFLLVFGSMSVRRRTRDRPTSRDGGPRPPRPGRGLFG
jgi:heme/copper-type cytochrome/quinol oxidase subunit 2